MGTLEKLLVIIGQEVSNLREEIESRQKVIDIKIQVLKAIHLDIQKRDDND